MEDAVIRVELDLQAVSGIADQAAVDLPRVGAKGVADVCCFAMLV